MLVRARWTTVAIVITASFPPLAWPQDEAVRQIRLIGRVHDEVRRPVGGVEVILNRTAVRATTDSSGRFSLVLTPSDSTIAFRRIGYRPLLLSLQPLPAEGDTIRVELRSTAIQLPEVIASAAPTKPLRYAGTTKFDEVFRRQRLGLGSLITRDEIESRLGSSAAQLLQGIPGVHYFGGSMKRLQFARCPQWGAVSVYIDGVRQVGRNSLDEASEVDILSRIHPSDIEMVEVFRGASQIPGVFHWDGCAVVAVWTRWIR